MSHRRLLGLAITLLGAGLAQGCSNDCPNCPGPPAKVVISPDQPSVLPGDVVKLEAEVLDADGHLLAGHPVTWSSVNSTVATVDDSGVVVGGGSAGTTQILAEMGGLADTTTISVVTTSTFSKQIYPILTSTCGLGGCHVVPGPTPTFNAAAASVYTALTTTNPANHFLTAGDTTVGELLRRLRGDTVLIMPPQQKLSTLAPGNYHLISTWIAQGALNN